MRAVPIGYDNFGEVIRKNLHFVDKSLFIKDFLDNNGVLVSLITRPRRFGKSMNLSMLHHFFASTIDGESTRGLFDHLKIAKAGEAYMSQQGKYPVIAMSFKDIKARDFKTAYADLCTLMSRIFREHREILNNSNISSEMKTAFEAVLQEKASGSTIKNAMLDLSYCLFTHYGAAPVILIDEYDTPIQAGYSHGYYEEIIDFMRSFFGAGLKSNRHLHRAVLTGILRVSKESLFSGLNNIDVYSLFRPNYSEYFGFTESEVKDLFLQKNLALKLDEIRQWYNGYQIGNTVLYNPWSIMNCINQGGVLEPYWVNTSDNAILKTIIAQSDNDVKICMESLLRNEPVEQLVNENFVFGDLKKDTSALWSLLLSTGYLKAIKVTSADDLKKCSLLFPNREIAILFTSLFKQWFSEQMGSNQYARFLSDLLEGRVTEFTEQLKRFLLESSSYFDMSTIHPEKFYHGFVLGLIASLRESHIIKSNRESGYGRYDIMIIPRDTTKPGIILEFKTAGIEEELQAAANEALIQVKNRGYETELRQQGIKTILIFALAFKGKNVAVAFE